MNDLITLVLATRNAGKTAEIRDLLTGFPVIIKNLDDFGPTPPVVEDGDSFDENAYKKSSFVSRVLGLPALADDSGLVVQALDGAPGIHSARWAGENATDRQRCEEVRIGQRQYPLQELRIGWRAVGPCGRPIENLALEYASKGGPGLLFPGALRTDHQQRIFRKAPGAFVTS